MGHRLQSVRVRLGIDAETGKSTLYDGAGVPQSLVVTIPPAAGGTTGSPTGIVFNGANTFLVTAAAQLVREVHLSHRGRRDRRMGPYRQSDQCDPRQGQLRSGAQYKGLALSAGGNGQLLYATDFHNGKIDVWDSGFNPVSLPAGAFTDPKIPAGFAPFGIQAINGNLYVTYAKQDADRHDDVAGKGLGYVDVFDPNGNLIDRIVSKGPLNAPWGLALAPAGFGEFAGALLVANFGDGRINAFDPMTGKHLGELKSDKGKPSKSRALGTRVRQRLQRPTGEHALLHRRSRRRGARPLWSDRPDTGARPRSQMIASP
jgi:uncharacterized protein (TIGR03118 family)